MTDHSQYREQQKILKYFEGKTDGLFWDIGAADGITNSNTRCLWELGWSGVLFEPCLQPFCKLVENYSGCQRVKLFNVAIGTRFEIGEILYNPELPQWSSMSADWIKTWPMKGELQPVIVIPIYSTVLHGAVVPDFLSIDTEGMDAEIIESFPRDFRPKLVVTEIDKPGAKERIEAEMLKMNYRKAWETIGNAAYERAA